MNMTRETKIRRDSRLNEKNRAKIARRKIRKSREKVLEQEYMVRLKKRELEEAKVEALRISELAKNDTVDVIE
jgi:hypothetical protein